MVRRTIHRSKCLTDNVARPSPDHRPTIARPLPDHGPTIARPLPEHRPKPNRYTLNEPSKRLRATRISAMRRQKP
eukprot:11161555-Lingulodinium_polyedra.AAC.1